MELEEVTYGDSVGKKKKKKECLARSLSAFEVWGLIRQLWRMVGRTGHQGRWTIGSVESYGPKRENISGEASTLELSSEPEQAGRDSHPFVWT